MMQIALLSDTHLTPSEPAFDRNLAAIRAWVGDARIPLTLHLGDITADGVAEIDEHAHAAAQLADWPGDLHILGGNHDIGDNPGEHGHFVATPATVDPFVATFGPGHWSIACGAWTLIGLDAQLLGRDDALERRQAEWLAGLLGEVAGPIGLFLHKPLFRDGPADRSRHHRYVPFEARNRLLSTLRCHDLRFVASGHTHQSRHRHVDGIDHIWVPSASFVLPDAMQERIGVKEVGVVILTLEGDRHSFALACPTGVAHHDLADYPHIYPRYAAALRAMAADRAD